jgi:hypothetical protein
LSGIDAASLEGSDAPLGLAAARERAQKVLSGLSNAEKVALVHGSGGGYYVGNVSAVTGVPALRARECGSHPISTMGAIAA